MLWDQSWVEDRFGLSVKHFAQFAALVAVVRQLPSLMPSSMSSPSRQSRQTVPSVRSSVHYLWNAYRLNDLRINYPKNDNSLGLNAIERNRISQNTNSLFHTLFCIIATILRRKLRLWIAENDIKFIHFSHPLSRRWLTVTMNGIDGADGIGWHRRDRRQQSQHQSRHHKSIYSAIKR